MGVVKVDLWVDVFKVFDKIVDFFECIEFYLLIFFVFC